MISKLVKENKDYVINLRRHFHMNPEPSWKEYETSKYVKEELEKMNIPYESIAETGIIATIKGNQEGRTVALRADMDALEVQEENDCEYASKNEGIMHACGHDGHTAMLLGAAKALVELKDDIKGTVKLFFQPAEEMVQGAKKIVEENGLEGVDNIFGIHLWSDLETGKVNCEKGPRMAAGDYVIVDIEGVGGHGSMPDQGVDAGVITAAFLLNIQSLVSREMSPLEAVVLSFGEIKTGTRFNVIPSKAHIEGTARCFDPEIQDNLPKIIKRYGDYIAESYRGKFNLEYIKGTPPTINEGESVKIATEVVKGFLGEDSLAHLEKQTGSEDMAYYLSEIPGAIAFVGCKSEEKGANFPHHHPKFDIDEDSLEIGTELYVRYAMDFLNR
ncbi:MAG: M20 family metallopeptidase [Bacillota bacterium]|nr:M20 family metallopeptidase [Bacillota bacterium]